MRSSRSTQLSSKRDLATANDSIYKIVDMCAVARAASDLPMTPSSLVIVTDRGSLKAYRVNETPTRGPSLQLVQAFNMTDAHGRFVDKVSDLAGRFPVTEGAGAHRGPASTAERTQLATETDRRIQKELADQIAKIVSQNGKDGWSFAAPGEIHTAIVDLLPAGVRQRIVEHVKSDLVKVEPARLISHFRSLRQI
jgi:Protein required for attachment to host cells